jgi:Spy/CpxP family protein refolding chaperone
VSAPRHAGSLRSAIAVAALAVSAASFGCGESTPAATTPGASGTTGPAVGTPMTGAGAEQSEGDEHRRGHHGGVAMLIAMSIHDLDLSADQKAKVEQIRTDLLAKLEPARTAGKDLAGVLADGVAAGAVDRAKADAAIDKLVTQTQGIHDATADAMNQLHAALTGPQRATLVDKLNEHFEKWKEANGHEEQDGQPHRSGHLMALVKDLSLSQDQAQKIKTSFHDLMKAGAPPGAPAAPAGGSANPQDHQHKEVADHMQAFATAFKADAFDAKTLSTETAANGHMAKWGATRMERFLEAAAPVLTSDQRTKLAQIIRDRAGKQPT